MKSRRREPKKESETKAEESLPKRSATCHLNPFVTFIGMENNITKLFVYGSLRSGFHHPAYEYISKYFTLVSEAKVRGYLYDLGDYPAATPTTDDALIIGELYELRNIEEFSWAMGQLDAYEGVAPAEGEEQLYKRELTEVFYGGESTQAWIYWLNGDLTGQQLIPSGDVLDFIQQKSKL